MAKKILKEKKPDRLGEIMGRALGTLSKKHSEPSPFTIDRDLNHWIEEAHEQGFYNRKQLNQVVAGQIGTQAYIKKDKRLLNLMYLIKTAPTGKESPSHFNYGDTIEGQNLIQSVSDKLDADQDLADRFSMNKLRNTRDRKIMELSVLMGQHREKQDTDAYKEEGGPERWQQELDSIFSTARNAGLLNWVEGQKKWEAERIALKRVTTAILPNSAQAEILRNLVVGEIDTSAELGTEPQRYTTSQIIEYSRERFGADISPSLLREVESLQKDFKLINSVPLYPDLKSNVKMALQSSLRTKLKLSMTGELFQAIGDNKIIDQISKDFYPLYNEYLQNVLFKVDTAYRKLVFDAVDKDQSPNPEHWNKEYREKLNTLWTAVGKKELDKNNPLYEELQEIRELLGQGEEELTKVVEQLILKPPKKVPPRPLDGVTDNTVTITDENGEPTEVTVRTGNTPEQKLKLLEKHKLIILDKFLDSDGTNVSESKKWSVSKIITKFRRILEQFPITVTGAAGHGTNSLTRWVETIDVENDGVLDSSFLSEKNGLIDYLDKEFDWFEPGEPLVGDQAEQITTKLNEIKNNLVLLLRMEMQLEQENLSDQEEK